MNYEIFLIIFLLFISNFLLRFIFNKVNYNAKIKFILFDSLYISLIFSFWGWVLYYFWILSEYKTIDLWYEILLYLFLFILLPFIYIFFKKIYLNNINIKVSIYYPLIEILIIILALWIVSYFI